MSEVSCISTEVYLSLLVPGSSPMVIDTEMRYNPKDPYAIVINFRANGGSIEWVFARDLLSDGVHFRVGQGDVRLWPGINSVPVVFLSLSSPDGAAVFEIPCSAVNTFLTQTYALVPKGTESNWFSLDKDLASLLN